VWPWRGSPLSMHQPVPLEIGSRVARPASNPTWLRTRERRRGIQERGNAKTSSASAMMTCGHVSQALYRHEWRVQRFATPLSEG
jgi:hypothetical protein